MHKSSKMVGIEKSAKDMKMDKKMGYKETSKKDMKSDKGMGKPKGKK